MQKVNDIHQVTWLASGGVRVVAGLSDPGGGKRTGADVVISLREGLPGDVC